MEISGLVYMQIEAAISMDFRVISLSIAICLSSFIYGLYQRKPLREELDNVIKARVQVVSMSQQANYNELTTKEQDIKGRIDTLDNLLKKQLYFTEVLNILSRALPQGAWLTHLTFNKNDEGKAELILEGTVYLADSGDEIETVNKIVTNLKNVPEFARNFNDVSIISLDRRTSCQIYSNIHSDPTE